MLCKDRVEWSRARVRTRGVDAEPILTHECDIRFLRQDRHQPRAIVPAQGSPGGAT